jgi:hypothetical protein
MKASPLAMSNKMRLTWVARSVVVAVTKFGSFLSIFASSVDRYMCPSSGHITPCRHCVWEVSEIENSDNVSVRSGFAQFTNFIVDMLLCYITHWPHQLPCKSLYSHQTVGTILRYLTGSNIVQLRDQHGFRLV